MELLADFFEIERVRMRGICRSLTHTVSDERVLYNSEEFTIRFRRSLNNSRILLIQLIELLESKTPLKSLPSVSLLISFDEHLERLELLIRKDAAELSLKDRVLQTMEINERIAYLSDILSSLTFLYLCESSFRNNPVGSLNREYSPAGLISQAFSY